MSYLIIEPVTDIYSSLSLNMMKNNKIHGLLDMECRYTDNRMELYYEIQGMQSLKEYIVENGISYNLARQLYFDIAQAVLNGEEFFLNEDSYVLDLEFIFWDRKNKRAKLCCVPELQMDFQADIRKLTEELIEFMNHNEQNVVEFIYGIYGLITDNGFIISDVKSYIKEFKPGTLNKTVDNNKKQQHTSKNNGIEFIQAPVTSEKIQYVDEKNVLNENKVTTNMNNSKENIHKKYILCIDKASLRFKEDEKGYININLQNEGVIEDEGHWEFSVGRSNNCSLVLPVCFVSRHHAVFYLENGNIYIEDTGSANGTFINNEKIPANVKTLCNVNDIISFAGIKCRLSCK